MPTCVVAVGKVIACLQYGSNADLTVAFLTSRHFNTPGQLQLVRACEFVVSAVGSEGINMKNKINLDFGAILEIALKGVRRSSVFMGLGVNAARDPENKDYQLSGITQIQLVPENVPKEAVEHFKKEFQIWIVAGALREATEAFALFLDELHRACSVIDAVKSERSLEEIADKQRKFSNEGFPNKLNNLEQKFGVKSASTDMLLTIYKARNCLTHRRGLVGPEDIKNQTHFTLRWRGMDIFAVEPNGNRIDLNEIPEGGVHFKNGAEVKAQFVTRSPSFNKGVLLALAPRDLAEICWFLTETAKEITRSAVAYAQANDVTVKDVGKD